LPQCSWPPRLNGSTGEAQFADVRWPCPARAGQVTQGLAPQRSGHIPEQSLIALPRRDSRSGSPAHRTLAGHEQAEGHRPYRAPRIGSPRTGWGDEAILVSHLSHLSRSSPGGYPSRIARLTIATSVGRGHREAEAARGAEGSALMRPTAQSSRLVVCRSARLLGLREDAVCEPTECNPDDDE
jgi:hypothetical protein